MLVDFHNTMARLSKRFRSEGYEHRAVELASQQTAAFVKQLQDGYKDLNVQVSAQTPPTAQYVDLSVGVSTPLHVRISYNAQEITVSGTSLRGGFEGWDQTKDPKIQPISKKVGLEYRLVPGEWVGPVDSNVVPVPGDRKPLRLPLEMFGEAFEAVVSDLAEHRSSL